MISVTTRMVGMHQARIHHTLQQQVSTLIVMLVTEELAMVRQDVLNQMLQIMLVSLQHQKCHGRL